MKHESHCITLSCYIDSGPNVDPLALRHLVREVPWTRGDSRGCTVQSGAIQTKPQAKPNFQRTMHDARCTTHLAPSYKKTPSIEPKMASVVFRHFISFVRLFVRGFSSSRIGRFSPHFISLRLRPVSSCMHARWDRVGTSRHTIHDTQYTTHNTQYTIYGRQVGSG